jgi:ppGpp synthetase/RelA/SpoT-type nucleotidyltranferase
MILDPKLYSKYKLYFPYFEFIQNKVDETLLNFSKKNGFAYSSRLKTFESLCEKIETGRYSSWNDIDDLIGCVIIIPNLSQEIEVLKFLESVFEIDIARKRGSTFKNYDTFKFDSTRLIARLKKTDEKANDEIFNIKFEVQIRSAFEHAWSVTTHDLAYKSPTITWQMLRLSTQLKSSVEQLDMIVLGAKEVSKQITKYKWPEIDIKIEILKFLNTSFEKSLIPNELKPKDFSRLVDNIYYLIINNLNIRNSKQWKKKLKQITDTLNDEFEAFQNQGFPRSLSLYQIVLGILAKHNLLSQDILDKKSFYKSQSFDTIFPNLNNLNIPEFRI